MDREAGYSLIEMTIVVAMIAILAAVTTESIGQQPYSIDTAITQFSAILDQAGSLARAQGGRLDATDGTEAYANTGATLWVAPDPSDSTYSVATLYRFRPIKYSACSGCVLRDPTTEPLRVHAILTANVGGVVSTNFSIFFSTSGRLTAVTDSVWDPTKNTSIDNEPDCDPESPPTITFSSRGNQQMLQLECNEASIVVAIPRST